MRIRFLRMLWILSAVNRRSLYFGQIGRFGGRAGNLCPKTEKRLFRQIRRLDRGIQKGRHRKEFFRVTALVRDRAARLKTYYSILHTI